MQPPPGGGATLAVPECVHCGFCLPVCPTYDVLGTEMDNPRGRLYLMRALEEGRIEATAPVVRHLDLCLGCRACETECPSGVPYGRHLERARARLHGSSERPLGQRLLEALVLRAVALPSPAQRAGVAVLVALHVMVWRGARSSGTIGENGSLPRAVGLGAAQNAPGFPAGAVARPPAPVRAPGLETEGAMPPRTARFSSGRIAAALRLLAAIPPRPVSLRPLTPALGVRKLRVGFLEGCVNRWVFGPVNAAAARLLAASGCDVVAPGGQRCCGALHAHSGDLVGARRLARTNIQAFETAGDLDAIVVTAAGCGSVMKGYGELFKGDAAWEGRARRFASKVKDALELLSETGLPCPAREVRAKVAYHDACHLAHAQGIRAQPRALLAAVPGITLVPLAEADRCCGSAGIYNLLHPEAAAAILEAKLQRLRASGADVVAAANPGCLLQIAAGARGKGLAIRAVHPIEILAEACLPPEEGRARGDRTAATGRANSMLRSTG